MKPSRWIVVACAVACAFGARAGSSPGQRLTADDIVVVTAALEARTLVAVNPGFDYTSCSAFPRPMDLRCDLFAQGGFDADGRQYTVRSTDTGVSPFLSRTEIWRSSLSGTTELVAFLEPRETPWGTYDDGRIEKVAVDPVRGYLYVTLTTKCFHQLENLCTYQGEAHEVVRVTGLRTLIDVICDAGGGITCALGSSRSISVAPADPDAHLGSDFHSPALQTRPIGSGDATSGGSGSPDR